MPSVPTTMAVPPRGRTRRIAAVLFLGSFAVYLLTMSRGTWTTDVYGANWTSWHIVTTGSPWIDGTPIPDVGHRSDALLAIVQTHAGHTAFGRFPGVVAASLPAYALFGRGAMSIVPGSLTAALLTACSVVLMFLALRRYLSEHQALLAAALFGFATPVWTVSANLMWPHTLTVLGIAGMAWASSSGRWWWAGVFGGIALWGRLHVAIVIAVLAVGVGIRRRDPRLVAKAATTSSLFLLGSCAWNHWVYGTWNPLGGYFTNGVTGAVDTAGANSGVSNYLGMWIAPDRGILVWSPVVLLLLPALARSWRHLPDWSTFLLLGGLVYTIVQSSIIGFTGGTGFYGYRYGLEFLACATPALVLSVPWARGVARALIGPVLAVQAFAFLLGGIYENLYLPETVAWHQNAFVHTLDRIGPASWVVTVLVGIAGFVIGHRLSRTPEPAGSEDQRAVDEVAV